MKKMEEIPEESRAGLMRVIDRLPPMPGTLLEIVSRIAAAAWGIGFADGKLAAYREMRETLPKSAEDR